MEFVKMIFYIITSQSDTITENDVLCFNTLNEALTYCEKNKFDENYVIGGAKLYYFYHD